MLTKPLTCNVEPPKLIIGVHKSSSRRRVGHTHSMYRVTTIAKQAATTTTAATATTTMIQKQTTTATTFGIGTAGGFGLKNVDILYAYYIVRVFTKTKCFRTWIYWGNCCSRLTSGVVNLKSDCNIFLKRKRFGFKVIPYTFKICLSWVLEIMCLYIKINGIRTQGF